MEQGNFFLKSKPNVFVFVLKKWKLATKDWVNTQTTFFKSKRENIIAIKLVYFFFLALAPESFAFLFLSVAPFFSSFLAVVFFFVVDDEATGVKNPSRRV